MSLSYNPFYMQQNNPILENEGTPNGKGVPFSPTAHPRDRSLRKVSHTVSTVAHASKKKKKKPYIMQRQIYKVIHTVANKGMSYIFQLKFCTKISPWQPFHNFCCQFLSMILAPTRCQRTIGYDPCINF